MKNLVDKIALVTGAASGIGRATTIEFARNGADVVMVDINDAGMEKCSDKVRETGRKGWTYNCDVSDKNAMEELSKKVIGDTGGIDILVNCAGVGVVGDIREITLEDWEWIIGINLWGTIYGVHFFLPGIIERQGHIVNISSGAGLVALPQFAPYCTTKFAVLGMAETMRAELRRLNVGVTVVCPGIINTAITTSSRIYMSGPRGGEITKQVQNFYANRGTPPERVARDIVKAVRKNKFLCISPIESGVLYWLKRIYPGAIWRLGAYGLKRVNLGSGL